MQGSVSVDAIPPCFISDDSIRDVEDVSLGLSMSMGKGNIIQIKPHEKAATTRIRPYDESNAYLKTGRLPKSLVWPYLG